ncbi:uncharacterized protein F5891DRAFT_1177440 [Suillus fuscotomentosus]|uniref:Uncharacterized protein n=1 Tax=Suillus fuscotomentosus TaxID=1912939 RepID=A0AAD4DPB2_9AGAM|nr:uncharacterized protein F5891DRAFT_1177440 [Suillus fuscotomentosus]KAG1887926.1 hypothetical protein F5891DRAFT_1177440 [Suillus fuscotomentosus]
MSQAPPCRTVPGLLFFTPTALSAAGRFPPSYIPSSILLISAVNFIHVWPSNDKGESTPPLSHVSLPPLRRHRQGIPISPMGLRSYIHNVNHSPRGLNQATLQAPPFYDQLSSYTINIRHRLFARPLTYIRALLPINAKVTELMASLTDSPYEQSLLAQLCIRCHYYSRGPDLLVIDTPLSCSIIPTSQASPPTPSSYITIKY